MVSQVDFKFFAITATKESTYMEYVHTKKKYIYPKITEAMIQRQILDWLRLRRVFHYRQNVGAQKMGNRFVRWGVPGLPDIVCVVKGIYIGLEVKADKNEQSLKQVEFGVELERAGGKYFVVRSLDEVIECLAKL